MFSIPKTGWLYDIPGLGGGSDTCDDLHSKGSSAAAPDLAVQADCVRGSSPEAWDFHRAQVARNCETPSFPCPVTLLDLNNKLIMDAIGGCPVQDEGIPANLVHCEVSQIWNLLCIRIRNGQVTKKSNCMLGFR